MQAMMPQMADWQWYQSAEAQWGSMETPQKMGDGMQFMPSMDGITPDKLGMPGQNMCQMYDDSMLKADGSYLEMPMEGYMLPHRLFDSSPEKSEQGLMLGDANGSNTETTSLESGEIPELKAPESPRGQKDSLMPLRSPNMLSPSARCLASPTPTTPKRQCYVPETPSPDRMHCSWLQQPTMPYSQPATFGGIPMNPMGYYGQQAHEQVIPEFLQMMSGMPSIPSHEGAHMFSDLAQ